ncbi:MAG: 30S ribosomal protein S6 [Sediminibacterium sp.]|nr:30S ribosomal protein S6 [Sediminibacterium sp.]
MQHYELMVIFTPILSDDGFKKSIVAYESLIKANQGEIVHSNPWGLKNLAYPIQKKTTGIYWVVEFKGDNQLNEILKVQILRDETIMRHFILKLDRHGVHYNDVIRRGGFPKKIIFKEEPKD